MSRRARRSLQLRLACFYGAGAYLAGFVVLVVAAGGAVGARSTVPAGQHAPSSAPAAGIGPHQVIAGVVLGLIVLVPVTFVLGWFAAGRMLRPLRAITTAARDISAGDLHRRLDLGEPTNELTELGSTLDDLFARLETAFDAQRHFVANASHELRTPLAGLRTLLEVTLADPDADAGTLRSACREALALGAHQERLVRALLALATSERGVSRVEPVDLAEIARTVLGSRTDDAARAGVRVTDRLVPAVTAGDPRLLESLVTNLVDNAIRYNHSGGEVAVTTGAADGYVRLAVSNSGPAVPDEALQRLLQPFQRLPSGRGGRPDGHGLGLAIVDAVTRAHRGTLTLDAHPEGGLRVSVRFTASGQWAE